MTQADGRFEAELNRILLVAYVFRAAFGASVSNRALTDTSLFNAYQTYENARDVLVNNGLIGRRGRWIELTDRGVARVMELLSIDPNTDNVRDAFIRRLRVFTLFPTRLSEEERESLFTSFILLYSDSCHGRFADDLLLNIADDYQAGLRVSLWRRLDRAFMLLRAVRAAGGEGLGRHHIRLAEGFRMLDRYAYLAYLWRLYRFNKLALHTVVRFASVIISPAFGTLAAVLAALLMLTLPLVTRVYEPSLSALVDRALEIIVLVVSVMLMLASAGRLALIARTLIRRRRTATNC
ncbi:MAG: hypothetical protein QXY50_07985 [Candidatus Caldarchaeum sp.]